MDPLVRPAPRLGGAVGVWRRVRVRLWLAMRVWLGVAGVASISLATTALGRGLGTSVVGSPLTDLLARQESLSPQVLAGALGSTMTIENPSPSVCGSHELS